MKRIIWIIVPLICLISCRERNPEAVSDLLDRIGGNGTSKLFETCISGNISENGEDTFIIGTKKGKPYIQGSSLSALTAGIGWYLNHHAHINLSWNNLTTDLTTVQLPLPEREEKRTSSAACRYYLNYCTFSYSMAFWSMDRWQKEIDWMALHGVNMPLMLVGTDVVWKNMLEEAGYTLLMDDFGSGYSSLNMLKEMPLDILKMDLRFLSGDETKEQQEKSRHILRTLISLAHSMHLYVIMEGVETESQIDFLKEAGCACAQGFVYSRPIAASAFEEMLSAQK